MQCFGTIAEFSPGSRVSAIVAVHLIGLALGILALIRLSARTFDALRALRHRIQERF
jgi:hypothetical protein